MNRNRSRSPEPESKPVGKLETTAEELEAFDVVKTILTGTVNLERVQLHEAGERYPEPSHPSGASDHSGASWAPFKVTPVSSRAAQSAHSNRPGPRSGSPTCRPTRASG